MWLAPIVPWALVGSQGSCLAPTGASALGHIIESWLTPWPPSWSTPWPNPSPTSCPAQLWPTVSQIHLCKFCILCIKWCYTICPLLDLCSSLKIHALMHPNLHFAQSCLAAYHYHYPIFESRLNICNHFLFGVLVCTLYVCGWNWRA